MLCDIPFDRSIAGHGFLYCIFISSVRKAGPCGRIPTYSSFRPYQSDRAVFISPNLERSIKSWSNLDKVSYIELRGECMTRREEILRIFPDYMKKRFEQVIVCADRLQEIRMAVGRPVRILLAGKEFFISGRGSLTTGGEDSWYLTERELEEIIKNICQYSIYAFENEIRQGYLTVQGGHRIGVAGKVVICENGLVRNITHIRFLNIRISHEIIGAADEIMPFLYEDNHFLNTVLVSPPGCGKTTLLRDIVRQVSDGNAFGAGRQVGVVDERSEIAGSFLGIPQNNVGIRTDVLDACPKVQGMMLLMRSMAPAVVAVDEIGSRQDMRAIQEITQCGSKVVATMHGGSLEDVTGHLGLQLTQNKEDIQEALFDRYFFLKKKNGIPQIVQVFDRNLQEVEWWGKGQQKGDGLCCG